LKDYNYLNVYTAIESHNIKKIIDDTIKKSNSKIKLFKDYYIKTKKIDFVIALYNENETLVTLKSIFKDNSRVYTLILENNVDNKTKEELSKYGTVIFFDINKNLDELKTIVLNSIKNLENSRMNWEVSSFLKYQKRVYKIPNSLKYLTQITEQLTRDLGVIGIYDKESILNVRFGIQEMIINAIEHGNLQINFEEKSKILRNGLNINEIIEKRAKLLENSSKKVKITFILTQQKVTYIIKDQGSGFDIKKIMIEIEHNLNTYTEHGRGIFLTKKYFDEFYYNKEGNEVTLVIYKR